MSGISTSTRPLSRYRSAVLLGMTVLTCVAIDHSRVARAQCPPCPPSGGQLTQVRMHLEASTSQGDWVFLGGGRTGSVSSARVDLFNAELGEWFQMNFPSGEARHQGTATSGCGLAFFAGGITGGGSGSEAAQVDIYDSALGHPTNPANWVSKQLSVPRRALTSACVGQWALFAGGHPGTGSVSGTVDVFDCNTMDWHPSSPFTLPGGPRLALKAATVGPYVLFTGGATVTTVQNTIDIYDSTVGDPTNPAAWSTFTLSQARYVHAAVTVGSKVFIAGGLIDIAGTTTNSVEVYDLNLGPPNSPIAWSTTMNLSAPRYAMMATVAGDCAYFAGGLPSGGGVAVDTVDIYCDDTATWSTCTLSQARAQGGAGSARGMAVFGGGFSGTSGSPIAEDEVDIFSPWVDLDYPLAGAEGSPQLWGAGPMNPGSTWSLRLTDAASSSTAFLVLGLATLNAPFACGTLVPSPLTITPLPTDATGKISFFGTLSPTTPACTSIYLQYWISDPSAPCGYSASNALTGTTQ